MKQLLLPVILICFAIFCLGFVHMDNMEKQEKELSSKVKKSNTEIIS